MKKNGNCEFQDKSLFKLNSEGLIEIPDEFRELVINEKGQDYFNQKYEIITDKEQKKGRIKGVIFTSDKNKTRRKKSEKSEKSDSSMSILLKNTPKNIAAADAPLPSVKTYISPSQKIDIHIDGIPKKIDEEQIDKHAIITKPLPKKIRIKKSEKIIEIREPNIMNALRDSDKTNDAYVNQLLDYDPASEKEQPPEGVPLEKSKQFNQIEIIEKPKVKDTPLDSELNYDFLYPSVDDPEFNIKLSKHKEFFDTKYDGKIYDFKNHAESMCHAEFELSPHQIFVKNFMSVHTPYNSLLMFHGLGVGKTCSAIGVAEEMRSYMKQIGMRKQILIIASPNVQDNFRLQLFDESKLKFENGIWKMESCIGKKLLDEINPTNMNIPK